MKTAIRIDKIEIDVVIPNGVQWVNVTTQRVELGVDNKVTSISPREGQTHRRVDRVALEMIEVVDPVTGLTVNVSVAGLGLAIKGVIKKWLVEDNPNTYLDLDSGLVVLNGTD